MGLDMYAYVAAKEGQQREFYESAEFDDDTKAILGVNPNLLTSAAL